MTKCNKKQRIADVRVMNHLLQAIPDDIYNLVDACKNAKEMWERFKRLMFGSELTSYVRHSRLMDEFDKFATKEGESLEFLYERLTTLANIIDRNNVRPISVSINTKFLNYLQREANMLPWNQAVVQDGRVHIQTKNTGYNGNATKNAGRQDRKQVFNVGNGNDESNQIVQRDGNAKTVLLYDAKAVSEVNASSKVHNQMSHVKRKNIIHTSDDDQIDSNIIFDDPFVENNGGTSEHDSNTHDGYNKIQMLAYNVQREAEKTTKQ
nr:hypothetical protein [Tanacetum cinerariifolium]